MRKQVFGRRLKRTNDQRKALFSGLISSMIIKGRIKTSTAKAKSVRGDLEKLVTSAKTGNKTALNKNLKPFEIERMVNDIAPVFKDRPGGYTRTIRTGNRFSDNASMVILEWTEKIEFNKKGDNKKTKKVKPKTTKTKKTGSVSRKLKRNKPSVAKAKEGK